MQRRPQVDFPQDMASHPHTRLGHRRNLDGRHPKHGWLLRRTLFPRRD